MSIAHGGIGDEDARLLEHPLREALRPEFFELLLRARRARRQRDRRHTRLRQARRLYAILGLGRAVDDRFADVGENARCAVALARPGEEFWRFLYEARGVLAARKAR